jgi:hypothetical protein
METTGGGAAPPFGVSPVTVLPSVASAIATSRYPSLSTAFDASSIPGTMAAAASGGGRADLARGQDADWTVQELLERIERLHVFLFGTPICTNLSALIAPPLPSAFIIDTWLASYAYPASRT